MKTISLELADELTFGNVGDVVGDCEIIEQSEWVHDHKSQYMDIVFKFDNKFYQLYRSRQGSYHTDWYYDEDPEFKCNEVEKVKKVTYEWKNKITK